MLLAALQILILSLLVAFALIAYFDCSKVILSTLYWCRFVWRKKIERDVSQGQKVDISVKGEKKKQRERMVLLFPFYYPELQIL